MSVFLCGAFVQRVLPPPPQTSELVWCGHAALRVKWCVENVPGPRGAAGCVHVVGGRLYSGSFTGTGSTATQFMSSLQRSSPDREPDAQGLYIAQAPPTAHWTERDRRRGLGWNA